MAVVQLNEKTSVDLLDGEVIICANIKNAVYRYTGELGVLLGSKGFRQWHVNIVITNKRVITVPYPDKKDRTLDSINYSDIAEVGTHQHPNVKNDSSGYFHIITKDDEFYGFVVYMEVTAKNILKAIGGSLLSGVAGVAAEGAKQGSFNTHQDAVNRGESFAAHQAAYNKEVAGYNAMSGDIMKGLSSSLGIIKARNYLVELIGNCMEMAPKLSPEDIKEFEEDKALAEKGDIDGYYRLGYDYQYGCGTERDIEKAIELHLKAAEKGHAKAQNCLGVCYENGQGVSQDLTEATKWYRKAAEQGDAQAQNNLGVCYRNGTGVPQDFKEAAKWYKLAADQGHEWGQSNLKWLKDNGKI